jgi:membrane protein required for colicin V production
MLIDIILLFLLLLAGVKGYRRGLIVGVFSFVAVWVGLAAAVKLSIVAAGYLKQQFSIAGFWVPLLSFLLVFFAVYLLIRIGARALEGAASVILLGWFNKLGGILFYTALYTLVYSVILFYLSSMGLLGETTTDTSMTFGTLQTLGPKTIEGMGRLFPFLQDMFTSLKEFFAEFRTASPGR